MNKRGPVENGVFSIAVYFSTSCLVSAADPEEEETYKRRGAACMLYNGSAAAAGVWFNWHVVCNSCAAIGELTDCIGEDLPFEGRGGAGVDPS